MAAGYFGKYSGIVADNLDPENLGRLQVKVPTIFTPDEVVMARPALPYGVFFVPEPGDKVWIEFEGGDSSLPLWTGVQYVAGEWPKEGQANPPQKRVIKTPSGHVMVFNDKGGEEGIVIFSRTRVIIRSTGTVEIDAPNVIIRGRAVTPLPKPI